MYMYMYVYVYVYVYIFTHMYIAYIRHVNGDLHTWDMTDELEMRFGCLWKKEYTVYQQNGDSWLIHDQPSNLGQIKNLKPEFGSKWIALFWLVVNFGKDDSAHKSWSMARIRPICGQGIGSFSYFGLHCGIVPDTHKNAGTDGHGGPSYLDSLERFHNWFLWCHLSKSCGVGTGAHCRKLYDLFEGADWDQRYGSKLSPAKINCFIASNDQNWWVQNGMVIAPKWLDCQKVGDFPLHVPRLPLQIRAFSLDRLAAARHGSRI